MTDKEIASKAMSKAFAKGWQKETFGHIDNPACFINRRLYLTREFAMAFFGEELLCYDCGEKVKPPMEVMGGRVKIGTGQCDCNRQFENNEPAWEFHLKRMVISDNPIKYMEEYL